MRRFTADYLDHTREGMWEDDREPLADLALADRRRVLDVGCGTGEFTRVLAEEAGPDATVLGVDADTELLGVARDRTHGSAERKAEGGGSDHPDEHPDHPDEHPDHPDRSRDRTNQRRDHGTRQYLAGDATRLPVPDGAVDLVACQALLSNLPEPAAAIREFARVTTDRAAAVEPNNADVAVASTVDREADLEREAREAYLDGVGTDVALGDRIRSMFTDAGLVDVRTRRYVHEKRRTPPYSEAALEAAARTASGAGLADHRQELRDALSAAAYDDLRRRWRGMGREVVSAMRDGEYERVELVPFEVTVGRVP